MASTTEMSAWGAQGRFGACNQGLGRFRVHNQVLVLRALGLGFRDWDSGSGITVCSL